MQRGRYLAPWARCLPPHSQVVAARAEAACRFQSRPVFARRHLSILAPLPALGGGTINSIDLIMVGYQDLVTRTDDRRYMQGILASTDQNK